MIFTTCAILYLISYFYRNMLLSWGRSADNTAVLMGMTGLLGMGGSLLIWAWRNLP